MRKIGKISEADRRACRLIAACGFVCIENGKPCLESHTQLGLWRWNRLKHHQLVASADDGLLEDMGQTWKLTQAGIEAAQAPVTAK